MPHHFISYSKVAKTKEFAIKLTDKLQAGPPYFPVWIDERNLQAGRDHKKHIKEAIRTCDSVIFLMTKDSVEEESVCNSEWTWALKYKKPVIPLLLEHGIEVPFGLENRQYIDFTGIFERALSQLRIRLQELASPVGTLQEMKDRLSDAERDLRRTQDLMQQARIRDEIELLKKQILDQQHIVDDPEGGKKRVEERITGGLKRERQPEKPVSGISLTRFINHPPGVAPNYFVDRYIETKLIEDFLKNDAQRLITVVGRAGMGKTAMVCRLLKSLESDQLPDNGGQLSVDGIVYLSETTRRVTVSNIYSDLCHLLPDDKARYLDDIYKNPEISTEAKMQALLTAFSGRKNILLLDNFESLIDPETRNIRNAELDKALCAILSLPQHAVKVILTTRIVPYDLSLLQPGRQTILDLDRGLDSPYAENILRELDIDGKLGLKTAPADLLNEARIRTQGNPLALEALFAILSTDRDTTLSEILNDTKKILPGNVLHALVGEAFSRLDIATQRVMQGLAIYASPVTSTAVDYLLQPYMPGVDSAPVLKRLVNMHFVRKETDTRRYYMHHVDCAYAVSRILAGEVSDREKTEAPPFTQFALRHRGANYFKEVRIPCEKWKTIDDLAPQLAELDLRRKGEDYDTAASVLLEIDSNYLLLWGHFRLVIKLHERLEGKLSNPKLNSKSTGNLGTAYYLLGEYQNAMRYYEKALAIAKKSDRESEGEQIGNIGNVYRVTDELRKSIEYYEKALTIAKETGDRRNESIWLGNSGISFRRLKELEKAIYCLEKAMEITLELKDKRNEIRWLTEFGLVYRDRGEIEKAIEYYEKALKITRDIKDIRREGFLFGEFGFAYYSRSEIEKAKEYYERALKIAQDIGDRSNENKWLGGLGRVYYNLGKSEEAIENYEKALKIAQEIGNRQFEGRWLNDLGEVFTDEKQYKEALACLLLAKDIRTQIEDKSLGKTKSNLKNLKEKLSEEGFKKLKAEVEPRVEKIVRELPKVDALSKITN